MENFVKIALKHKGRIKPLLVDSALTNGTGLFNPSIFVEPITLAQFSTPKEWVKLL